MYFVTNKDLVTILNEVHCLSTSIVSLVKLHKYYRITTLITSFQKKLSMSFPN
jgi:hypothetical protein